MEAVTIGTGPSKVIFEPRHGDGFTVRIVAEGIEASGEVYMYGDADFRALAVYFEGLAASWRGWINPREWRSIESDLVFSAKYGNRGHCVLRVELRKGPGLQWLVSVEDLTIDVGEDLTGVAREVRRWSGV